MAWLEPVSLKGPYARLEPLSQDQCEGLDRGGEGWRTVEALVTPPFRASEDMRKGDRPPAWVAGGGPMMPWTVFDADGTISGMTTYIMSTRRTGGSENRLGPGMPRRAAQRGSIPSANCCC